MWKTAMKMMKNAIKMPAIFIGSRKVMPSGLGHFGTATGCVGINDGFSAWPICKQNPRITGDARCGVDDSLLGRSFGSGVLGGFGHKVEYEFRRILV